MRTFRPAAVVVVAALAGLAAVLAPSAHAESSPSSYASRLVQLINSARAQNGLHTLTVTSGTSTVASSWTQHLASQGALSHNPNLGPQLESHGSPNWTAYGENVGEAPSSSADQLFTAYMNSPEHRANILGAAYRYVGIGVVFAGSTAWNTLDFVDQYSTSSTSSSSTTTRTSTPHVVRHTTATAPKRTTRATARPAVRVAVKTAAAPRHATVRHPRRHVVAAAKPAVAPVTPTHSPRQTAADTGAALAPVLPSAIHVPSPSRDRLPILVAFGLIVVVGSRFLRGLRLAAA